MEKLTRNSFFEPIITVLGLGTTIITALIPIFSKEPLTKFFVNSDLAQSSSYLAFIFGIILIWFVINFYSAITNISLGKVKIRNKTYPEPAIKIDAMSLTLILLLCCLILSVSFISIYIFASAEMKLLGVIQAYIYVLFFCALLALFTILFAGSKQKYDYDSNKISFPSTLLDTLSRSGLVSTGIQIHDCSPINYNDALQKYGVAIPGVAKIIKVRTNVQKDEVIVFISSYDGKEIIKVIKREIKK